VKVYFLAEFAVNPAKVSGMPQMRLLASKSEAEAEAAHLRERKRWAYVFVSDLPALKEGDNG